LIDSNLLTLTGAIPLTPNLYILIL